jgi:hypothetical protein
MTRTRKALLLAIVCCSALTATASRSVAADSVLYAAGDIACDPLDVNFNGGNGTATACRMEATADIISAGGPSAVLALGDLQYDAGNLSNFQQSYDRSWGAFKAQTRPVIGNHEGITADTGAGYCVYFGAAAHCNANRRQGGAAFYSFDVGDWHVVVLNSNCVAAGGCDVGSPQYQWLQNDLAANPRACTLAAWHHPRWSSGADGSNVFMQPIWQLLWANGADLVLSGHSHDYERFAPMDAAGTANTPEGNRSFVVGTGGAYFTGLGAPAPGSEVRQNTAFGVLRLGLHPTSYDWKFVPASGSTFTDAGAQACHGPPDLQAPGAPGTLTATPRSPTQVDLSWAGSTDNVGVAGYEIWRGSGKAGAMAPLVATSGAGTASVDTTVAAGQGYRYQVRARDWAGNWSAMSNLCTVVTPVLAGSAVRSRGKLLTRWRLKPARARRVLARGRIRIPARRWAPTVIRVHVGGRLAAIRRVRVKHAVTMRLASWCKQHRYRDHRVTVTIRRPR